MMRGTAMGKGSVRRPRSKFVSDEEMKKRWNKVFGTGPPKEEEEAPVEPSKKPISASWMNGGR